MRSKKLIRSASKLYHICASWTKAKGGQGVPTASLHSNIFFLSVNNEAIVRIIIEQIVGMCQQRGQSKVKANNTTYL